MGQSYRIHIVLCVGIFENIRQDYIHICWWSQAMKQKQFKIKWRLRELYEVNLVELTNFSIDPNYCE